MILIKSKNNIGKQTMFGKKRKKNNDKFLFNQEGSF